MHTAREFEILSRLISSSSITKEEAFVLFEAILDAEKYRDRLIWDFCDQTKSVPGLDAESPFSHKPMTYWGVTSVPCSAATELTYTATTSGNTAQTSSTSQDSFESTAACEEAAKLRVCKSSGEFTTGYSLTSEK